MNNALRTILGTCLTVLLSATGSFAQSIGGKYEIGVNAGTFIYQGDLTPSPVGSFRTPGFVVGINASRRLTGNLSARIDFSYGRLRGDDAAYAEPEFRQHRAFNFSTPVRELTLSLVHRPYIGQKKLSPYVFAGIGGSFVRINRDHSEFDAAYFALEGISAGIAQDMAKPLPRFIPVAPVGAGARYPLSQSISLHAEAAYRFMSTDYLDGFSLAANPDLKDHYYKFSVGVTYAIGVRNRYECPVVVN
jgi:hypothetical protein